MSGLRYAELFAGANGLGMGLERAGWSCAWHAEWADDPRAVLSHHWPDVPLYGDVTTLDGRALTAEHGAIDLLAGGSPCQDLSVAGKRAGLGGSRSSLFFEQMRLWDETGADLCLWENVDGARSSNNGRDFSEVLRAFVGAPVPVPADGWDSAGVAAGPAGVAAWRVLDAQFFGVPQRRRRVFVLGTRTGRVDPAEVLSLAEGLFGDSAPSGEAREGVAADVGGGAAIPLLEVGKRTGVSTSDIRASATNRSNPQPGDPCHPLAAAAHPPAICLTGDVTHALTHEGHDASEDGTGRGTPIVFNETGHEKWTEEEIAGSLNAHEAREAREAREAHTIVADHETATTVGTMNGLRSWSAQTATDGYIQPTPGIPRRLMPIECERLMSWPDNHTLVPNQARQPMSDSARYKMCGNGVASVVSHWIGERLALALGSPPPRGERCGD